MVNDQKWKIISLPTFTLREFSLTIFSNTGQHSLDVIDVSDVMNDAPDGISKYLCEIDNDTNQYQLSTLIYEISFSFTEESMGKMKYNFSIDRICCQVADFIFLSCGTVQSTPLQRQEATDTSSLNETNPLSHMQKKIMEEVGHLNVFECWGDFLK